VQDLLPDFEFELSPPYLLYRTAQEVCEQSLPSVTWQLSYPPRQVNGLWFYQQEEGDRMTELLTRHATLCSFRVPASGADLPPPPLSPLAVC